MLSKPAPDRPELTELLRKAKELVDKMTPEEKDAMLKAQAESWARAEANWPKPKFHYDENGAKVYHSYEDYCNG